MMFSRKLISNINVLFPDPGEIFKFTFPCKIDDEVENEVYWLLKLRLSGI